MIATDLQHYTAAGWIKSEEAVIVACVFSALACTISVWHLVRHLRFYTMPSIQKWVVRIITIIPVYALSSALAVVLGPVNGLYTEFVRDIYEAFAVYSLLNLVLEYAGGEVDCVYAIENEAMIKMPCPCCCAKPRPRDAKLLRFCQRGVLQFVVVKPLMACIDVSTFAGGVYFNLPYQIISNTAYNVSYGTALYCLFVFYLSTKTLLKRFNPACKIGTVKMVIVLCYYQSLLVKFAPCSADDQFLWKNLLLCIEMLLFAIAFCCAFPVNEFMLGIPDRRITENLKDLFTVRDIFEGFSINFKPAYQDYALQRSENEAPETVRLRTFFAGNLSNTATALDLAETYKGKNKRMAFNAILRGSKSAGLRSFSRRNNDGSSPSDESSTPDSVVGIEVLESKLDDDIYSSRSEEQKDSYFFSGDDDVVVDNPLIFHEGKKAAAGPSPSKAVPRLAPPPVHQPQRDLPEEEESDEGWSEFVGEELAAT